MYFCPFVTFERDFGTNPLRCASAISSSSVMPSTDLRSPSSSQYRPHSPFSSICACAAKDLSDPCSCVRRAKNIECALVRYRPPALSSRVNVPGGYAWNIDAVLCSRSRSAVAFGFAIPNNSAKRRMNARTLAITPCDLVCTDMLSYAAWKSGLDNISATNS